MAHGTTIAPEAVHTIRALHRDALETLDQVRRLTADVDQAFRSLDDHAAPLRLSVDELLCLHEATGATGLVEVLDQIRRTAAGELR